jgi:hypothetical protein
VNSKYLLQLIVCILLGSLVKAEGKIHPFAQIGGMAYDISPKDRTLLSNHDSFSLYKNNISHQKIIKVRIRLHAAPSISVRPAVSGNSVALISSSEIRLKVPRTARCILPFYYLFLFRLTPF